MWPARRWGSWLALHMTPANDQDQAQVAELAAAVQEATGETVELAYVDQGYIGEGPNQAAAAHGIQLEVVKLPDIKGASSCCPGDEWSNGASAG